MREPLRLAVIATHPIQYHAPLYRELAARRGVDLTVFYAHQPSPEEQGAGFGVPFAWDVDLLSGYRSVMLRNRRRPATDGEFRGYDTPEITRCIRESRFHAVVVAGWHALTYWQAMIGCWRTDVPVLVRGDSQLAPNEPAARRLAKRCVYPLFMRRFAACLSVGSRSEEYFRFFGARTVVRSPHFVDNDFFAEAVARERDAGQPLRARLGIDADARVVLFAGKLVEKKRPVDVITAARLSGDPKVVALFAGDGPLREQCAQEARRLGVRVAFAGFLNQTQLPAAYAAADLLVLPSDARETWGLVANEAMASGVPVAVSHAAGCYPDLVVEGVTGYGFPLGDTRRIAAIVAHVCGSADHRRSLQAGAARHIAAFSVQRAADGVLEGVARTRRMAA